MKRMLGCLTRGIVALVLIGIIAAVAVSFLGGDDGGEKHTLIGEVLVFKDEGIAIDGNSCTAPTLSGGENLHIEDGTTEGVNVTLNAGIVTPEGNCSFEFVADVGETDMYAFTVNGKSVVRKDETIGKEIPEGYQHSSVDSADWWVSIWGSDFD